MVAAPSRQSPIVDQTFYSDNSACLEFLENLGIAVFPERLRVKGSRVEGWPETPVAEAHLLTRKAAGKGAINLAGRTGDGIAVLDLDAKSGLNPAHLLDLLLPRLEPSIIAVVKTGRGYHIWLAVTGPVGNGFCSAIGGEVFSEPHLAMLPPSIHPEGHQYSWVIQPRRPLAKVDLQALGLVPDQPHHRTSGKSNHKPPQPQVQSEFAALMAEAGIVQGRGVQELARCQWHDDRKPSLSINWEAALFHCFVDGCVASGGIGKLRQLLGRYTPTYGQEAEEPWLPIAGNWGCADDEAERLAEAFCRLGQADKARTLRDCKKRFMVGKCTGCGITPAFPLACKHPLCPKCAPGRLAADWLGHKRDLPASLTLLRLRPRDMWGIESSSLRKVRNRFNEWRERTDISAGLYGVRFEARSGAVILLALPSDVAIPESSRAFEVEVLAADQPPEACLRWLQAEYSDEARSWQTDDDLDLLLQQTKRRRRFQGFGGAYGTREADPPEASATEEQPAVEEKPSPTPLSKVSGGSHSGAKKGVHLCPFCGSKVDMYDFSVPAEEVRAEGGNYRWLGHPPGRRKAA